MDPEKVREMARIIARERARGLSDRQINSFLRRNRSVPFNSVNAFERQAGAMGISIPTAEELESTDAGGPGRLESFGRGARQGFTLGFGDELAGVAGGLANVVTGDGSFGQGQRNAQQAVRGRNQAAQEANPGSFLAGEALGAVAPTSQALRPVGLARRAGLGMAEAGAFGAGTADPDPSGSLGERTAERAVQGGLTAPLGLVGAGGVGVARRSARLARALMPSGRAARRPFASGLGAADDILQTTGAGARGAGTRTTKQAKEAFEFGKQLFDRPPAEIGQTVRHANFHRQAVQDGLSEAIADRVRRIGNPRKVVDFLASDPVRNRLRHATSDPEGFRKFMEVVDRAARLESDAALAKAGGEIGRNALVFGSGAGFSAALQRIF